MKNENNIPRRSLEYLRYKKSMKKLILPMLLILLTVPIIAEGEIIFELEEGRNNVTITQEFMSFYSSELVNQYPQIKSISISEYGSTYGYINAFGGIGLDILIEPNRIYEIYSSENITIKIKN